MMGVLTPIISAIVLALAAQAAVAPRQTADRYNGNPFQGVQMWPSRFYADQVHRLALPRMSGEARRKAEKVAMVPSFQWL